jgi:hypothetical protein
LTLEDQEAECIKFYRVKLPIKFVNSHLKQIIKNTSTTFTKQLGILGEIAMAK